MIEGSPIRVSKMNKEEEWEAFRDKWIHEFPEDQLREDFEIHWKRLEKEELNEKNL